MNINNWLNVIVYVFFFVEKTKMPKVFKHTNMSTFRGLFHLKHTKHIFTIPHASTERNNPVLISHDSFIQLHYGFFRSMALIATMEFLNKKCAKFNAFNHRSIFFSGESNYGFIWFCGFYLLMPQKNSKILSIQQIGLQLSFDNLYLFGK